MLEQVLQREAGLADIAQILLDVVGIHRLAGLAVPVAIGIHDEQAVLVHRHAGIAAVALVAVAGPVLG